jgi:CBS domain-containing protein
MSLERFCRKRVVTARAEQPVVEVARIMRSEHVGAVVIVDGKRPIGIITDRDLALRVLADGRAPETPVQALMTPQPVTVRRDQHIDDVVRTMQQAGVRRLPIVDEAGAVIGLVSLDDLSVLLAAELGVAVSAIRDDRGP